MGLFETLANVPKPTNQEKARYVYDGKIVSLKKNSGALFRLNNVSDKRLTDPTKGGGSSTPAKFQIVYLTDTVFTLKEVDGNVMLHHDTDGEQYTCNVDAAASKNAWHSWKFSVTTGEIESVQPYKDDGSPTLTPMHWDPGTGDDKVVAYDGNQYGIDLAYLVSFYLYGGESDTSTNTTTNTNSSTTTNTSTTTTTKTSTTTNTSSTAKNYTWLIVLGVSVGVLIFGALIFYFIFNSSSVQIDEDDLDNQNAGFHRLSRTNKNRTRRKMR